MNTGTHKLTQSELADIRLTIQLESSIQFETQKKLAEIHKLAESEIEASTRTQVIEGKTYNIFFLGEKYSDFPVISKLSKRYCLLRGFSVDRSGEWGYTVIKGYPATGIHNRLPKL